MSLEMPLEGRWNHADWEHDDERRLQLTLGLSVLLHAVLLFAWKLPPQVWKATDQAVLTVVLRAVAPAAQSSAPAEATRRETAVLVQKEPAATVFSVSPKTPAQGAASVPANRVRPVQPGSQGRVAPQANPGRPLDSVPRPVGVTVMLVVGGDGRVGQIYWDQLPALTDEQLRRVEAAIRARSYPAGQTINEIFDVRAFLRLPPARSEERVTPSPSPAAE